MARRGLPVFARPGPGLGPDLSGDFGVAFVGAGREKTVLVVLQLLTHSMVILARHPQCLRASRPHSITRCICNAPFFFKSLVRHLSSVMTAQVLEISPFSKTISFSLCSVLLPGSEHTTLTANFFFPWRFFRSYYLLRCLVSWIRTHPAQKTFTCCGSNMQGQLRNLKSLQCSNRSRLEMMHH